MDWRWAGKLLGFRLIPGLHNVTLSALSKTSRVLLQPRSQVQDAQPPLPVRRQRCFQRRIQRKWNVRAELQKMRPLACGAQGLLASKSSSALRGRDVKMLCSNLLSVPWIFSSPLKWNNQRRGVQASIFNSQRKYMRSKVSAHSPIHRRSSGAGRVTEPTLCAQRLALY